MAINVERINFMAGRKDLIRMGVAIFLATTPLLWAGSDLGYLPSVGPVPFQFLAAAKPFKSIVVEPKPARVQKDSAKKDDSVPVPMTMPETTPTPPAVPEETAVVAPTNEVAPTPVTESMPEAAADSTLSPQMFLKYFNKPATLVTVPGPPVQFKSPPPVALPSSKATYSVIP